MISFVCLVLDKIVVEGTRHFPNQCRHGSQRDSSRSNLMRSPRAPMRCRHATSGIITCSVSHAPKTSENTSMISCICVCQCNVNVCLWLITLDGAFWFVFSLKMSWSPAEKLSDASSTWVSGSSSLRRLPTCISKGSVMRDDHWYVSYCCLVVSQPMV